MRALAVTNMLPTSELPHIGTFVADQVESLRRCGVEMDVLHVNRTTAGAAAYRGLADALRTRVSETSPDVVHVMYGGVMARIAVRARLGKPVVVSFCGSDLLGIPAGSPLRRLRARLGVLESRRAARDADAVIVKSRRLHDALPAGLDERRVRVIPNGVDLDRFHPQPRHDARVKLGWPTDASVVLFPASPRRAEKRHGLAVAAVDALNHDAPTVTLRALDGVAHADVPLWLCASDVVIVTSTHEGSPNVVKEALACCVPVVSVDVGDVAERIADVPGCAIASADAHALAQALRQALGTPPNEAGRRRVEELALPAIAARIADVYRAAIGSGDVTAPVMAP